MLANPWQRMFPPLFKVLPWDAEVILFICTGCVFVFAGPLQGCGGFLTEDNSTFVSPDSDSDGKYDRELNCIWYIIAPENKLIELTFSKFSLERGSADGRCYYDYVQVRRLCGKSLL